VVGSLAFASPCAGKDIDNKVPINGSLSRMQSRSLTMAWNATTNYGDGWFFVIPGDKVLMDFPAADDVMLMPDQSAWAACDFSNAQRVRAS
jgi:hypothetical protein